MKPMKYLGTAIIMLLMAMAMFVFLAPRFEWRVDTVSSGSMEPALKVGGVVVTQPAEAETIKAGDIITFNSPLNNEITSHRVLAVENSPSLAFRTKGDANEDADPYVLTAADLAGKICFHLPYLGYAAQFIKTPLGLVLTLCLPGLAIVIIQVVKIWRILSEREIESNYRI